VVKEMAERKWMDGVLFPRRQREDFSDEYDSIASKVAKEWLLENGYEAYSYSKVRLALLGLDLIGDSLNGYLGESIDNIRKFDRALHKLGKEAKVMFSRDYTYFGIGPDFIAKKINGVFFVDAIVNQAKPKKYSATSYKIAEEYGFKTMVLKLDAKVKVGEVSLTEL
jgi:hypothetical protein